MLPPKFRLQQFFLKQVMGRNFLPKFIARGGGGGGLPYETAGDARRKF